MKRRKLTKDEHDTLLDFGYRDLTFIPGKGICGLKLFLHSIGLVVDIDEDGYDHRYCYPLKYHVRCLIAWEIWKRNGPTEHPDDEFWIKRKGSNPIRNPNYIDEK